MNGYRYIWINIYVYRDVCMYGLYVYMFFGCFLREFRSNNILRVVSIFGGLILVFNFFKRN